MTGKHSNTPWQICAHHGGEPHELDIELAPRGGWFLRIGAGYPFNTFPDPGGVEREFLANAALIVRAVNSHEALVEALELILPLAKGYAPKGQTPKARQTCNAWIAAADAALALARETP